MMKKVVYSLVALAVLASCSPKSTENTKVTDGPTFPSTEIAEGGTLYTNNCGKCHDLPEESKYSEEQWRKIVPPMAGKSKLDATQENKVLQYVLWKSAQK
jgi:hypothetical protein